MTPSLTTGTFGISVTNTPPACSDSNTASAKAMDVFKGDMLIVAGQVVMAVQGVYEEKVNWWRQICLPKNITGVGAVQCPPLAGSRLGGHLGICRPLHSSRSLRLLARLRGLGPWSYRSLWRLDRRFCPGVIFILIKLMKRFLSWEITLDFVSGLSWRCSASPSSTSPGCTSHRKLEQLQGPFWIPSGSLSFLFQTLARTIVIWLVFLIPSEMEVPGWHDGFSEWSLGGYIISIIGVFLFNNIVILPTIQKYRNKNRSM